MTSAESLASRAAEAFVAFRDGDPARDGNDWFDLGVEVSVDGETIDFATLFTALDRDIAGDRPLATAAGAAATCSESPVYSGRTATANANASLSMDRTSTFALGAMVGGALVALGVLIGSRIGRRS